MVKIVIGSVLVVIGGVLIDLKFKQTLKVLQIKKHSDRECFFIYPSFNFSKVSSGEKQIT